MAASGAFVWSLLARVGYTARRPAVRAGRSPLLAHSSCAGDGRRASSSTSAARSKKPAYVCSSCGHDSNKWFGLCPACREENTFKEFRPSKSPSPSSSSRWIPTDSSTGIYSQLTPIGEVKDVSHKRMSFGSGELDRLLGGGLVQGSSILFAGPPGVGKSTLALQMACLLCRATDARGTPYAATFSGLPSPPPASHMPSPPALAGVGGVAYISGEESASQVKGRASRLGLGDVPGLLVMNSTHVEDIIAQLDMAVANLLPHAGSGGVEGGGGGAHSTPGGLRAVIIDSIQTMTCEGLEGSPGQAAQVREAGVRLSKWARGSGVPIILVGHVTKSGDIAGPRVLEHLVDAVLYVEGEEGAWGGGGGGGDGPHAGTSAGLGAQAHRVVRATKNRFGSTSELGLFVMGERGFTETTPRALFLSDEGGEGEGAQGGTTRAKREGCAVTTAVEGTRALCVEVQALATRCLGGYPRHRGMGVGADRLHLAWAVLSRHAHFKLNYVDILANVVGGLRVTDPASDLALVMAVASSASGVPLPARSVFIGELGLGGEIRTPTRLQERLRAAAKLGFHTAFVGSAGGDGASIAHAAAVAAGGGPGALRVVGVRGIRDVLMQALGTTGDAGGKGKGRGGGHKPPAPPAPLSPALPPPSEEEEEDAEEAPPRSAQPPQPQGHPAGMDSSMDDDVAEEAAAAGRGFDLQGAGGGVPGMAAVERMLRQRRHAAPPPPFASEGGAQQQDTPDWAYAGLDSSEDSTEDDRDR